MITKYRDNNMQAHETLTMESGGTATTTTFTNRRRHSCTISGTTLLLLAAIFIFSLLSAGFLVYNFAACPNLPISTQVTSTGGICNGNHHDSSLSSNNHFKNRNYNDENSLLKPSSSSSSGSVSKSDGSLSFLNNNQQQNHDTDVRLPRSVIPISYNVSLIPFLFEGNFTFHGSVKIHAKIIEDCDNITIHAADLQVTKSDIVVQLLIPNDNSSMSSMKSENLEIKSHNYIESKQFLVMKFDRLLKKGYQCEIYIKYVGYLMDYLQGFYRSSYWKGNQKRWLAATQFQPTDARRAFPCFDEPALKAKFIINIARPKNMSSISNMPKVENSNQEVEGLPSYVWDNYEESLPMSTYLVAFAVTDFLHQSNEYGNFTVWTRSDAIHSAEYALNLGPKILKFFEKFFGIDFPLPKIDMIAVPDFQAGAMENWGLITYRETAMLYEEGISAAGNKQRVATVVAHELAHQWFGNLVTPSWWSDIWLNEGFASYVEYLGVDAIEPSWKSMDQFVVNEVQNVFLLDALSSSHKISVEVGNPDEINEIFDRISYAKGATIIRMMSHFLTSNVFRSGLKKYLKELSYKSAKQDDLWRFLTNEALSTGLLDNSTSVKEIMDTWTLQTGFPVVTIQSDNQTNTLKLHQKRFTYVQNDKSNKEEALLWWIPITYTTSNECNFDNTRPSDWIRRQKILTINDPRRDPMKDWYIFNIQQTSYYRINYDVNNWKLIISYLRDTKNFKKISSTNRAQLIDDALNLARGEYLDYNIALDITRYLEHEDDYIPWKAAITAFNFIDSMLIKEGDYHLMKKYILNLLDMVYKKVGFDDSKDQTDLLTIYKRVDILTTACHLGHVGCVRKCFQYFQNWMFEPNPDVQNPISPNLKSLVYCTAIQHGSEIEWDFAFERFIRTNVSSEKEILLSALGCSRETWILNRYLKKSLEGEHIRKQDVYRVFAAVSSNVIGQPIVFAYIRNHWKEIKTYLGSSLTNLNTIVKYSTRRMNNKFELAELKNFVYSHHREGGRAIQQAIEQVEVNFHWMDRNYKSIINWLKNAIA